MACARIFYSSCLVSGRPDKMFIWEKAAPPARATLPAEVRRLTPQVVSPTRDEFTISCKRSAEFCKEISEKVAGPGVTREKGCLRYPRLRKWSIISRRHRVPKENFNHLNLGFFCQNAQSLYKGLTYALTIIIIVIMVIIILRTIILSTISFILTSSLPLPCSFLHVPIV